MYIASHIEMLESMQFCVFILCTSVIQITAGRTAALILARGGSKAIRLKNLQTVGGQSLLHRAIHTAKLAGIGDVTVSTDHPLIALEAVRSGANIFLRSAVTAADRAPSIWGAQEFMAKRLEIDKLVLVQATSPFLKSETLRKAVQKVDKPISFDCIFSVIRIFKLRWHTRTSKTHPLNFKLNARPRRQDWDGELCETGAFYITRRRLIELGYFQNNK